MGSEKPQHSKREANSPWCEFGFKVVNQHCKQKQMLEEGWLPDRQGRAATAHSLVQELFLGLVSASTNFSTPTCCQSLGKPHTGMVQVPLCLARAGSEGGEPHSPVPQGFLAVESCSRLSQGWDTGRSCWDTKSSAVPDISRNRAQRKEERIQWGKSSFTLPASQALLPCLRTCQSLLPEKYLRSHLSVAGA